MQRANNCSLQKEREREGKNYDDLCEVKINQKEKSRSNVYIIALNCSREKKEKKNEKKLYL